MANYKFIAREDIGTREEQQDSHIVITGRNSSIAVVCDGLGGMQGGRIASQCIKKVVQKLYTENEPTIENAKFFLETFVNESIHAIINEGKIRGIKPMSTLTVLLLFKDVAFYTHVGDSRIYFFNNSFMKNRTKDHSILQILVDKGSVREEDMGTHPDQNKLYQCLGQADKISFTVQEVQVHKNDWFLLCTDGFWENLTIADLQKLSEKEESTASILLNKAKKNGGAICDNITFVAVYKNNNIGDILFSNTSLFISVISILSLGLGYSIYWYFDSPTDFQKTQQQSQVNNNKNEFHFFNDIEKSKDFVPAKIPPKDKKGKTINSNKKNEIKKISKEQKTPKSKQQPKTKVTPPKQSQANSKQKESKSIVSAPAVKKNERTELQKEIKDKFETIKKNEEELKNLKKQIESDQKEISNKKTRERSLRLTSRRHGDTEADLEKRKNEADELKAQIKEIDSKIKESKEKEKETRKKLDSLKDELRKLCETLLKKSTDLNVVTIKRERDKKTTFIKCIVVYKNGSSLGLIQKKDAKFHEVRDLDFTKECKDILIKDKKKLDYLH
ncbi:MAG: hypothetical protein E7035_09545 [Verrucomicrobiaceae bacterium]|nr:hypothetical protein [Verrucomicrobiaceae bacterium]